MRIAFRRLSPFLLALVVLAAGCKGDPKLVETWVPKLSSQKKKERLEAIERLQGIGGAGAVAALLPVLKDEALDVRAAAVKALGKLDDASAAAALIDAIDLGVGDGTDPKVKAANDLNKEIAEVLGELGDKSAVKPLANLATRSKNSFVKVAAINSLGTLGDTSAVEPLMAMATDEAQEPYVNKKAIQALGNLGDPAAVPAIVKMLFRERKGVSFYPEASYAVFQIGGTAAEPLLKVLAGQDPELKKFCEENDIFIEATYAKAAQVLADLGEARAVPQLRKYLGYEHPDAVRQLLVRMQAADALGRLRARDAVSDLAKRLDEEEANVRKTYADALVMIGETSAQPQLFACAQKGDVMDARVQAREACYVAISKLGDEKALAQWESWEKSEPKASEASCIKGVEADDAAGKAAAAEHCGKLGAAVTKLLGDHKSRLSAYGACKKDVACWTGKLKDADGKIRERAAFELGRLGDLTAVDALVEAMKDKDLEARYAAILAGHWLVTTKEGVAALNAKLAGIEAQLAEESGKVHYVKVNEDLKRLAVKVRRLAKA